MATPLDIDKGNLLCCQKYSYRMMFLRSLHLTLYLLNLCLTIVNTDCVTDKECILVLNNVFDWRSFDVTQSLSNVTDLNGQVQYTMSFM